MVARLPSPALVPGSEESGTEQGNAAAMTAAPHAAEIPVGTQRQPDNGVPQTDGMWHRTPSAGSA